MKFSFFPLALMLALTVAVASCEDDSVDNIIDDPTISGDTSHLVPPRYLSLDALNKWFADEYSINFITQFSDADYMTVAEGMVLLYTPATDSSRIKRLLYYIGDNVLNAFPARTIAKYMPPTIYLVDSLKEEFEHIDDQTTPGIMDRRKWFFPITGHTTSNYLVLGNAGPRLDEKKEGLREELISLFVDRLLYNTTLPDVEAVQTITENAMLAAGATWGVTMPNGSFYKVALSYPYWDGLPTTTSSTSPSLGSYWMCETTDKTVWLGRGIRKVGRAGYVGFEYRNTAGTPQRTHSFRRATVKQDFADFAAFIITTPSAEREAYYAQVEADKRCATTSLTEDESNGVVPIAAHKFQVPPDTLWYDARFPYGGTLGANAMRDKDAYVKGYFKTNLAIELE
jgi:hypothetical protein